MKNRTLTKGPTDIREHELETRVYAGLLRNSSYFSGMLENKKKKMVEKA